MNTNDSSHHNTPTREILAIAKKLIAIPSTENNKQAIEEILNFTANQLSSYLSQKYISNSIPSLLVHNTSDDSNHFNIILNAHLDVVPGEKEQFDPVIKNSKLYGRGAYDMKAAAAVMIVLFKEIAQKIPYPLAFQLVTDEEIGGNDGTKYQITKGITADFVLAGENTNGYIRNSSKSPLWIKIKTYGKTSHAAYPWLGENALGKMYELLNKLEMVYPSPKELAWKTTINLAKIETSNNTFNRVPDDCTAWLDIRIIPEEQEDVFETIKKIVPEGSNITITAQEQSAYTDPKNPFIVKLQHVIKKINGKEGIVNGANGSSDIRFFNKKGIPGVEFGPKGDNSHADNEWVDIASLEEYYHILKEFLLSL